MHYIAIFAVLSSLILLHVWVHWNDIYRWINLPRRAPDYVNGPNEYWFDEFVAWEYCDYRDGDRVRKKEHFLVGASGKLEYNNTYYRIMDMEEMADHIQKAYQRHIQKKFEEIVLD